MSPPKKTLESLKEELLGGLGDLQSTATISFCEPKKYIRGRIFLKMKIEIKIKVILHAPFL